MLKHAHTAGAYAAAQKFALDGTTLKTLLAALAIPTVPGAVTGAITAGDGHRLEGAGLGALGGLVGSVPGAVAGGAVGNAVKGPNPHAGVEGLSLARALHGLDSVFKGVVGGGAAGSALGGGLMGSLAAG